jgi:hypothetical protein
MAAERRSTTVDGKKYDLIVQSTGKTTWRASCEVAGEPCSGPSGKTIQAAVANWEKMAKAILDRA